MDKNKLLAEQRSDLLWAKIADVWLPFIDEILEKGYDDSDEDHQKCVQVMANTIKGTLYMKGMHPPQDTTYKRI